MNVALLGLRALTGGILFAHGAQKAFTWGGRGGIAATADFFAAKGYPFPRRNAVMAAATEMGAGSLLVAGAGTPLAAAMGLGVMINAVGANAARGFWNSDGGYEYPLLIGTVACSLAGTGPGRYSVDRVAGVDRSGPTALIAAAILGALSGVSVLRTRRQ